MSKKQVSRRGFIAAAAVVVGGGAYVKAEGQSEASYDDTMGAMLSNKLLAELEPIAMYQIGDTQPMGYYYTGYDKHDNRVGHVDKNLRVEVSFHKRRNHFEARVTYIPTTGDICYRSARPFRLKYRASRKSVSVSAWNDCGGCLSAARQRRIINSFNRHIRARNLSTCAPCKDRLTSEDLVN